MDALYKKIGQLDVERDFLAARPGISLSSEQRRQIIDPDLTKASISTQLPTPVGSPL